MVFIHSFIRVFFALTYLQTVPPDVTDLPPGPPCDPPSATDLHWDWLQDNEEMLARVLPPSMRPDSLPTEPCSLHDPMEPVVDEEEVAGRPWDVDDAADAMAYWEEVKEVDD